MKKKIKLKYKNIAIILIYIICFIMLFISIFKIIKWKIDANNNNILIDEIKEEVNIEEIKDGEIINQNEDISKFNPYWDYIKMNMINVDFSQLKKTNHQTKGWIQVNGTNINYPFVQTKDNKYYLTHSFNKSYNDAGWLFVDYRNKLDGTDKNTIIYAHGRIDTTMFGSLKNILKSGWLKDSNNYVVKLSTEYENTLWQVFSVYHIPTTSDYIQTEFSNSDTYQNFLNILLNRSNYDFNTLINENDNILTLSTCYNKSDKVVLHAKLIKKVNR
ncbi:MAG: class B sortase [Bacilli bacterium]|nr:class B sortase [Bacilli bacterium]MDD4407302.1 class B sortase [Bacilli bacterium]